MLPIYCDTGGYDARLAELESGRRIVVHQFKYENKSRRIRRGALPSNLRYIDSSAYTYDDLKKDEYLKTVSWDQLRDATTRFAEILSIVGTQNRTDAKHLDSAFMTGCKAFLTSDKADIWAHRGALQHLTGMRIFLVSTEWNEFVGYLGDA